MSALPPSTRQDEASRTAFGPLEAELMTAEQYDASFRRAVRIGIANAVIQLPRWMTELWYKRYQEERARAQRRAQRRVQA